MKTGAIVQARLSSTRLPNKVLLPLAGKAVLWHVLDRLMHSGKLEAIVLATSNLPEDRKLKEIADEFNIPIFFGSLNDLLSRYYHAAKEYDIDPVVRITADCPLISPEIVDEVIDGFMKGGYDYYSLTGSFPDGLDTTVISLNGLSAAYKEAKLPSEREHAGVGFFEKNSRRLKIGGLAKFKDRGGYRWTLDEPEDYEFLKLIYSRLYKDGNLFSYNQVFDLLEKEPELKNINSRIVRNEGYLKSLEQDKEFIKQEEKRE